MSETPIGGPISVGRRLPVKTTAAGLALILLIGFLATYLTWSNAFHSNGSNGFPLDDAWIHLQFAENLKDYGSYSYYRDQAVTSGSTSPLYTFALALGLFATGNEIVLSYFYGVLFLLIAGVFAFKLTRAQPLGGFGYGVYAWLVALLVVLEPRLEYAALSGMETTLFIMLALAAVYYYRVRRPLPLAIASALLIWTRPEAMILFVALGVDLAYHTWLARPAAARAMGTTRSRSFRSLLVPILIAVGSVLSYAAFNIRLSGTVLPNTYAAKLAYYAHGGEGFPASVLRFAAGGHSIVVFSLAVLGTISGVFYPILRRRPTAYLAVLLWPLGLFLAYWWKLPYLYQNGRYLMPALPFLFVLAMPGLEEVIKWVPRALHRSIPDTGRLAGVICVAGLLAAQFAGASLHNRETYASHCKYIADRQVAAAKWVDANLPADAVIATHDVGAMAFYSERRIVDMVGLISPEMKSLIGKPQNLIPALAARGVTHVAVLRDWFEIVNVNPIFQTDERYPEIMEVFKFDAAHMHVMDPRAARITTVAGDYLANGQTQQARRLLEQSVQIDPYSSRTQFLLGYACSISGDLGQSETALRRAIQLNPGYWDARLALANVAIQQNRLAEADSLLSSLVADNPNYFEASRLLRDVRRRTAREGASSATGRP